MRSNNREQRPRRAGQRNPKLRLFVIPSSQNRNLERGRQFDNLGCFSNSTMLSLCVFSSGLYHYYIQKEAEGIPTKLASFPKQDPYKDWQIVSILLFKIDTNYVDYFILV